MDRVAQYADPMLLVSVPAQPAAAQTARSQNADRSDFGKMVRQKQQKQKDTQDGQKTQKQDGKDTQSTQKPQDGQAKAKGQEAEITDSQYMLAAALLLQPGVRIVRYDPSAEETVEVETQEDVWMPEVEAVTDEALPVVQDEAGPRIVETAPEAREEVHETYHEAVRQVVQREDSPVETVQEKQTEETEIEVTDAAETDQPVFGPVEAAPVKVADNAAPVDTRAPDAAQQITSRIENFLVDQETGGRVEFTLIPESLGKITVEIARDQDGSLRILLTPSTLRAAEFLNKNSGSLQNLLGHPSRPTVDVEVRSPENTENPFLNPNAQQQQEQQRRQQEQQRRRQREGRREGSAVDFVQQLRLGLVGLD